MVNWQETKRIVEGVANAIQDEAQRMQKVIPELHSETSHLKAVRDTLTSDHEDRTRQAQRLESELEKARTQPKESVPVRLYYELRDQLSAKLRNLAEERSQQSAEIKYLTQCIPVAIIMTLVALTIPDYFNSNYSRKREK